MNDDPNELIAYVMAAILITAVAMAALSRDTGTLQRASHFLQDPIKRLAR